MHQYQSSCNPSFGRSALDVLKELSLRKPISTSLPKLDTLLSGGIQPKSGCVEICGPPGSGKTQFCMQLAANCTAEGALENGILGDTIYVDTEGGFTTERFVELLQGSFYKMLKQTPHPPKENITSVYHMMKYLSVYRVYDHIELNSILEWISFYKNQSHSTGENASEEIDSKNKSIRLIVIDSISFPFRHGFKEKWAQRSSTLFHIANTLNKISHKMNAAIIVTNHITTKLFGSDELSSKPSLIVPALGDYWSGIPTIHLYLQNPYMESENLYQEKNQGLTNPQSTSKENIYTIQIFRDTSEPLGSVNFLIRNESLLPIDSSSEL